MAVRVRERQLGLQAQILGFGDLLSNGATFVTPYLQRQYEWGEAEVSDMAGDIHSASNGGYQSYFLGHIVGVAGADGHTEIVDGQQRLITTTIMLAWFRDRITNAGLKQELQACILQDGQARVTPRPSDAAFLREWVQTPGKIGQLAATYGKGEAPYNAETDAQALMALAARTIHAQFDPLGMAALEALAVFILDRAAIVFITAANRTMAAILYRGMNMRGKRLSTADLIKLEAIEGTRLSADAREEAARTWEATEERMKDKFPVLLDMLPLIVSRETQKRPGDLEEWSRLTFRHTEPESLLLRLMPAYANVYEEILKGEISANVRDRADEQALADVNRLVKGLLLLEDESWMAPAIAAVQAHRDRPTFLSRFFRGLDRLAFASFLDAIRNTDRVARFAAVVRAGSDETLLSHAFSLKPAEAITVLRRVAEPFKRETWRRRAIAARINAAFPNGYAFAPAYDFSLEHVMPTGRSPHWKGTLEGMSQSACANLIGNFILVRTEINRIAGNKSFEEKMKLYYKPGEVIHPITEDIRRFTEWGERQIVERTDRLTRLLAKDWNID